MSKKEKPESVYRRSVGETDLVAFVTPNRRGPPAIACYAVTETALRRGTHEEVQDIRRALRQQREKK